MLKKMEGILSQLTGQDKAPETEETSGLLQVPLDVVVHILRNLPLSSTLYLSQVGTVVVFVSVTMQTCEHFHHTFKEDTTWQTLLSVYYPHAVMPHGISAQECFLNLSMIIK